MSDHFKIRERGNPELEEMLRHAAKHIMTPAERAAQRRSYVIGAMAMGSDQDEAAYAAAYASGDLDRIGAELEKQHERQARAEALYDQRNGI